MIRFLAGEAAHMPGVRPHANDNPDPHDEIDALMRANGGTMDPGYPEDAEARSERRQTQQEHRDDYREEML
jgi:hypothetical protein